VSLRATKGSEAISLLEKEGDCFVASLLAMTPSAFFYTLLGESMKGTKGNPKDTK
jgi:hypothetical protein